jgi:hypothetical protein
MIPKLFHRMRVFLFFMKTFPVPWGGRLGGRFPGEYRLGARDPCVA